jgi:hypothetical protein
MTKLKDKKCCSTRYEVTWLREGIAPLIFNLGPRWKSVVSLKPRPLYPRGSMLLCTVAAQPFRTLRRTEISGHCAELNDVSSVIQPVG